MKIVSILLLHVMIVMAGTYEFNEERYIYSIDKNISLEGSIHFNKEFMKISYTAPEQRVIEVDADVMSIYQNRELVHTTNLKEDVKTAIYMNFIKLMYQMDLEGLKVYFKVIEKKDSLHFIPNELTKAIIKSIDVTLQNKTIQSIHTKMQSGDEISLIVK